MNELQNNALQRAKKLFEQRKEYESLWETTYDYVAPERAHFFRNRADDSRNSGEVGERVFDSTAIDEAERLANLLISQLTPPWQKWARLSPGPEFRQQEQRDQATELLAPIEDRMFVHLAQSNFYQELQPTILDRIVGGTGAIRLDPEHDTLKFKCLPLSNIAAEEDNAGRIVTVAYSFKLNLREAARAYGEEALPEHIRYANQQNPDQCHLQFYEINALDAADQWQYAVVLEDGKGHTVKQSIDRHPRLFVTRWAKIPGSVYGRGPGMRALSDVRALNKIKELSLRNAALAVAGAYTVADDGVVNPWTIDIQPGAFIPVASNDPNNPSIAEFPRSGDFDVSMFQMDNLRSAIQKVFLADQYGPTDRTPMSAEEVRQRTRNIAQEMGATVARMQYELLLPLIKAVYGWMAERDEAPDEVRVDGETIDVQFVSQLALAQWAETEQQILDFTNMAAQMGQIDTQAGMVVDMQAALRRVAEIRGLPPEILRSPQEIQQMMEQAAQAQAMNEAQGAAAPPEEMAGGGGAGAMPGAGAGPSPQQ